MNLIISFSGRNNGNCDQIAQLIAGGEDTIIYFRELNAHSCSGCSYECFQGSCKYRSDDVYRLYEQMCRYDKVLLIVPMYCGNPASLYFIFNERSQDYFVHNDTYDDIIRRLYIIGIYGKADDTPDYIPCLEKWFEHSPYHNRVLGIERHLYGQKLQDSVLDIEEVKEKLFSFIQQ